jgi:Tfp pilus assembly protein PilO
MATSGVMADFARLPPQRKALVFIVIGLALGALYFQFFFKSLKQDVEDAENEHGGKSAASVKATADIADYEKLKPHFEELQRIIAENQKALPTEAEVPAFFETLNRKVTETGVDIRNWRQLPEEPIEGFVRVPVEIEIEGTYLQIKRFFASLVQKDIGPAPTVDGQPPPDQPVERERIVSIENLTVRDPAVRNRQIMLTAHFVATTYRQDERAVPKPAPGAAGDGQPPSTLAPAMPSAPPPAAAGTPKGAQKMTEDAIEKGDKRDRAAAGVDEAKTPNGSGVQKLKGGN